jgi:hypothetical protein
MGRGWYYFEVERGHAAEVAVAVLRGALVPAPLPARPPPGASFLCELAVRGMSTTVLLVAECAGVETEEGVLLFMQPFDEMHHGLLIAIAELAHGHADEDGRVLTVMEADVDVLADLDPPTDVRPLASLFDESVAGLSIVSFLDDTKTEPRDAEPITRQLRPMKRPIEEPAELEPVTRELEPVTRVDTPHRSAAPVPPPRPPLVTVALSRWRAALGRAWPVPPPRRHRGFHRVMLAALATATFLWVAVVVGITSFRAEPVLAAERWVIEAGASGAELPRATHEAEAAPAAASPRADAKPAPAPRAAAAPRRARAPRAERTAVPAPPPVEAAPEPPPAATAAPRPPVAAWPTSRPSERRPVVASHEYRPSAL